jgi:hypothetical protein
MLVDDTCLRMLALVRAPCTKGLASVGTIARKSNVSVQAQWRSSILARTKINTSNRRSPLSSKAYSISFCLSRVPRSGDGCEDGSAILLILSMRLESVGVLGLTGEQLALILVLSPVDLALGEALVEYLECGGATVTTEIKALTIKRIAAGRPAH